MTGLELIEREINNLREDRAVLLEALREALNQMDTHHMEHRDHWSNEKTNMMSAARLMARRAIAKVTHTENALINEAFQQ